MFANNQHILKVQSSISESKASVVVHVFNPYNAESRDRQTFVNFKANLC